MMALLYFVIKLKIWHPLDVGAARPNDRDQKWMIDGGQDDKCRKTKCLDVLGS